MREIKFRAWFKDTGEMKEVAMNNVYKGNTSYLHLSPMPFSDYRAVDLMQYTGLKDKNGVEVYEGDIIRYNDSLNGPRSKMTVKFEGGSYTLDAYREGWCYELGSCLVEYVEIIGNIYENPELLEEN